MSLPPLAYARPESLEEAVTLLAQDGACALAGGQSLVPALAARSGPRPSTLIDLAALPALDGIALGSDGCLRIGALVRQRAAERSPLVARHAPLLAQALAHVGHPSTRNRGTIVGSLVHADPAAEVPAVAVALDGVALVAGPRGSRRELAVAALLAGPHRTTLGPGELVTELRLPAQPPGERQAWLEFAPRRFDLALVGAAARVRRRADGAIVATRLVLAGVAPTPFDASAPLAGGPLDDRAAPECAADRVASVLAPPSDARASARLRRHLARTLALRALQHAAADAADA